MNAWAILKKIRVTYVVDWVIWGMILALGLGLGLLKPHVNDLPLPTDDPTDNPNFMYPYHENTVPSWAAVVVGFGSSAVAVIAAQAFMRSLHDVHHGFLSLLECAGIHMCFVSAGKAFAGRYRPHYLALLAMVQADHSTSSQVAADKDLWEGMRSFPSGHSAVAFAGLAWLSLYLAGKFKVFSPKGGESWKTVICGLPLMAAWIIAITRTRDYHHNFSDIMCGAFIGIACAIVAYFNFYHSLLSENCHLPKTRDKRLCHNWLSEEENDEEANIPMDPTKRSDENGA
ncbi:phosphatidic acid phosphatase type 2/haloperoxidase [Pelomyxa schiedti]|nr:phosphatidic acid phosphatase type 2/haloperoxidase [Pelomyxa schiedti]